MYIVMSARTKIRGKHRRDRRPMRRPKPPDDGDIYYTFYTTETAVRSK